MSGLRGSCGSCAMWDKIAAHGRGTTTGFCTHPINGKVTRSTQTCPFYTRAYGKGFDENAADHAFHKFQRDGDHAAFERRDHNTVPLEVLRARAQKARRVA